MRTAQIFITSDDKEFKTAGEAAAHQASLDNAAVIDAFLAAGNVQKAQAGYLRAQIPAFLAFQKTYVAAPVAETTEQVEETAEA